MLAQPSVIPTVWALGFYFIFILLCWHTAIFTSTTAFTTTTASAFDDEDDDPGLRRGCICVLSPKLMYKIYLLMWKLLVRLAEQNKIRWIFFKFSHCLILLEKLFFLHFHTCDKLGYIVMHLIHLIPTFLLLEFTCGSFFKLWQQNQARKGRKVGKKLGGLAWTSKKKVWPK